MFWIGAHTSSSKGSIFTFSGYNKFRTIHPVKEIKAKTNSEIID